MLTINRMGSSASADKPAKIPSYVGYGPPPGYYSRLGVFRDAPSSTLRTMYRARALRNRDYDQRLFYGISIAYAYLSDDDRRRRYNDGEPNQQDIDFLNSFSFADAEALFRSVLEDTDPVASSSYAMHPPSPPATSSTMYCSDCGKLRLTSFCVSGRCQICRADDVHAARAPLESSSSSGRAEGSSIAREVQGPEVGAGARGDPGAERGPAQQASRRAEEARRIVR